MKPWQNGTQFTAIVWRACEADAAEYTELKHAYERAAYRFWEPIPTKTPLPAELR